MPIATRNQSICRRRLRRLLHAAVAFAGRNHRRGPVRAWWQGRHAARRPPWTTPSWSVRSRPTTFNGRW